MRKRKEQRGLIDIDHIDVPFFGPSPPKTMAEKAMTYFRVDDVFQSYLDAGSSVVSDFLKTSENDVLSFCDFLRNKLGPSNKPIAWTWAWYCYGWRDVGRSPFGSKCVSNIVCGLAGRSC